MSTAYNDHIFMNLIARCEQNHSICKLLFGHFLNKAHVKSFCMKLRIRNRDISRKHIIGRVNTHKC